MKNIAIRFLVALLMIVSINVPSEAQPHRRQATTVYVVRSNHQAYHRTGHVYRRHYYGRPARAHYYHSRHYKYNHGRHRGWYKKHHWRR